MPRGYSVAPPSRAAIHLAAILGSFGVALRPGSVLRAKNMPNAWILAGSPGGEISRQAAGDETEEWAARCEGELQPAVSRLAK
jgi:hypothetical protein